jgi:predicted neutral ceramidase superfamily lipid hydrolase
MKNNKSKDRFEDLDSDYKSAIDSASEEEIRRRISEAALNEAQNQENKKQDQDLKEKKEAAKMAGEQYKEATKSNKLRIGYARSILEARGKL